MEPLDYCRDKIAPPGSAVYYAVRFAPADQHDALLALHTVHAEITEVPDEVSDAAVGEFKLNWWREEIARLVAGEPRHPATQALAPAVTAFDLDTQDLGEMVEGASMDLTYGSYPSFRELSVYCHRTGGALARLLVSIAGADTASAARFAHDLGVARTLQRRLLSVRRDAQAGRVYIPEDDLSHNGVARNELMGTQTTEAMQSLFRAQADRIHGFMDQADSHLADDERAALRSGIILAALDRAQLRELAREAFPLLERRVELTPLRRFWIAWRTARRQQRLSRKAAR